MYHLIILYMKITINNNTYYKTAYHDYLLLMITCCFQCKTQKLLAILYKDYLKMEKKAHK